MLEKDIQNICCQYLELKRHFFWRQNTAPTVQKSGDKWAFRRMPKYALKGVPDVILIKNGGQVVFIEFKRPGGKMSEFQVEFRDNAIKKGAEYHVIMNLDQLIEIGL